MGRRRGRVWAQSIPGVGKHTRKAPRGDRCDRSLCVWGGWGGREVVVQGKVRGAASDHVRFCGPRREVFSILRAVGN